MPPLPAIRTVSDAELAAWLEARGVPRYRLKQIRSWLFEHWVTDFRQMANLPASLRDELAGAFRAASVCELERVQADDGTEKFLFGLADGEAVETVLIRAPDRTTVCISTQVGCPVRCVFCASGRHGLVRDLESAEILEQVVWICRHLGARVDNVVVMGMGEPLLNLDLLIPALDLACSPSGLGIGARHVTVSTSGITAGIRRLADLERSWNLALSLHATCDEARSRLIPDRYREPLADVFAACRYYRHKTNRMVTLEHALLSGRNDTPEDARELARIARDLRAKVNLIPCNPVGSLPTAPESSRIRAFQQSLLDAGVQATVRREKGASIAAACGQLRLHRQTPEGLP